MPTKFVSEDGQSVFWLAETGKVCATEPEAVAEENAEEYSARVQLFIDSRDWNRGQSARAKALITEFLAFEDTFTEDELTVAIEKRKAEMDAEKAAAKEARRAAMKNAREARGTPEVPPFPAEAA
jgi:hypothetical protein